jgi:hypothetical protein
VFCKQSAPLGAHVLKTAIAGAAILAGTAPLAGANEFGFSPGFSLSGQGVLYGGGIYDNPAAPTTMSDQMRVFYQIPAGLSILRYPP